MKDFREMLGGKTVNGENMSCYSVQKKFIQELMSARGTDIKYDLVCTPMIEKPATKDIKDVKNREVTKILCCDLIKTTYKKSILAGSEYYIVMVPLKGETLVPYVITDILKQCSEDRFLQMVLYTDGLESKNGGETQLENLECYFIFSLHHTNEEVRFARILFSFEKRIHPLDKELDSLFDHVYDIANPSTFIGRGKFVDVDYSSLLSKGSLSPLFYLLLKNSNKKNTDEKCVELGSIMDVATSAIGGWPYTIYHSEDFKTDYLDIIKEKEPVPAWDDKPLNNIQVYEKNLFLILFDKGNVRFLWNNTDRSCICSLAKEQEILALKLNTEIVDAEYFIDIIVNAAKGSRTNPISVYIRNLIGWERFFSAGECLRLEIPILSDINIQKKEVENHKLMYFNIKQEELEAERKRLGILDATADIVHMLGTTFSRQAGIMLNLKKCIAEGKSVENEKVKRLMDTVDYVTRFIKNYCGNFEDADFKFRGINLLTFIEDYCEEWKNSLGDRFDIVIKNEILDTSIVDADVRYLKVAFDALFDNAYRHGFAKKSSLDNKVIIKLSLVTFRNRSFVRIEVLNNGLPFAPEFSLELFKSRGRYTANSGHTGLGGNHIYQIVHKHNGFLALSNESGLTGFDILLPVNKEISNTEIIYKYEKETV